MENKELHKIEGESAVSKLGVMIYDLRISRGFSIDQLAEKTNINKSVLTKLERNPGIFKISTINKILGKAYNASLHIEFSF